MNNNVVSAPISIRLEPYHMRGIEKSIERKRSEGFAQVSRSTIVKEALEEYFEKRKISKEIKEEMKEES